MFLNRVYVSMSRFCILSTMYLSTLYFRRACNSDRRYLNIHIEENAGADRNAQRSWRVREDICRNDRKELSTTRRDYHVVLWTNSKFQTVVPHRVTIRIVTKESRLQSRRIQEKFIMFLCVSKIFHKFLYRLTLSFDILCKKSSSSPWLHLRCICYDF